jgi:hypothetical protein
LNEQVKRNQGRFPKDFMFQLTAEEIEMHVLSRSQFATLKRGSNIKYLPYAFTEHGAVMLASVLNSKIAVRASIEVVRAFVRFRSLLGAHKELARKIATLEEKYDGNFRVVFTAIKRLMEPSPKPVEPEPERRPIGFYMPESKPKKRKCRK